MANYSIYIVLLWVALFALRPTRKLALVLLPWAVFACLYDWMRLYPNYLLNTIDIRPLYETERQLFGVTTEGGRIILAEWFNSHHTAWADLLAGLFYLCWLPIPLVYCLSLFFEGKRRQSLHFGIAFLWVNICGFVVYYLHPAAPPWYALEYGFTPQFDVPLTGAGLARFDSLVGVPFFGNYYSGTSNIFAAIPSLHSAYVLTAALYVLIFRDKWWKATLFFFITIGIWCSAVYTCHHYVVDVILGILTALLAILILEQALSRLPLLRKAYNKYAKCLLIFFALLVLPARAQGEWHKMSPRVKTKSVENVGRPAYVFVKTTADATDLFQRVGGEVYATFGDIQIVGIPQNELLTVAQDSRVVRIEMGSPMTPSNALSASILGVNSVREGLSLPQAFTGSGVVVGLQDVGFDLTNPNFYSSDMSRYRIRALWDMLSTDTLESTLPVGRDYTTETELLALRHSADGLIECHGSHTLGTAAGSGYGSIYTGMAPDADICLVANVTTSNKVLLPTDDDTDYGSAMTALGFKYIFDYADAVDKPCVISFSEGSYQGLEEEDLLFYEVLDQMVSPGHIIVASAGNSSQYPSYIHKPVGQERAGCFMRDGGNQLYFLTQATSDFTHRLTIYAQENTIFDVESAHLRAYPDSIMTDTLVANGRDYVVMTTAYPSAFDQENIVVECLITGPDYIGYDNVAPISVELLGTDADVEMYRIVGYMRENALDPTLVDMETSHNIHSPSSAPAVISVGATAYATGFTNMAGDSLTYDYGTNGVRASFSSIGPTYDHRTKPDVMAPGTSIFSSTNSFYFEANPDATNWSDLVESYAYDGRTYYWKTDAGTSMACPMVAGTIALWLEAKPDLTRQEIIDIFSETSTHPDPSLLYPNNQYGYGQIDAYAGLLKILGIDRIEGLIRQQTRGVNFTICEGHIFLEWDSPLTSPTLLRLYSSSGTLLQSITAPKGSSHFSIPTQGLSGVLLLNIEGNGSNLLRVRN